MPPRRQLPGTPAFIFPKHEIHQATGVVTEMSRGSCAALCYFGGSLAEFRGSCREIEYFMFAVLPCQKNR